MLVHCYRRKRTACKLNYKWFVKHICWIWNWYAAYRCRLNYLCPVMLTLTFLNIYYFHGLSILVYCSEILNVQSSKLYPATLPVLSQTILRTDLGKPSFSKKGLFVSISWIFIFSIVFCISLHLYGWIVVTHLLALIN